MFNKKLLRLSAAGFLAAAVLAIGSPAALAETSITPTYVYNGYHGYHHGCRGWDCDPWRHRRYGGWGWGWGWGHHGWNHHGGGGHGGWGGYHGGGGGYHGGGGGGHGGGGHGGGGGGHR